MLIHKEVRGVEKALDALSMRMQVESDNMANLNTPHYVPSHVNFEASLKEAVEAADQPRPVDGVDPANGMPVPDASLGLEHWQPTPLVDATGKFQRVDGNGVTVEQSMAEVVKTAGKYSALTSVVAKEYANIKYVVDQR